MRLSLADPLTPALSPGEREKKKAQQLDDIETLLVDIQHALFDVGAELATPDPKSRGTSFITAERIEGLESAIDRYEIALPPLKAFILPGGAAAAAWLHLARTVCRCGKAGGDADR